MEALESLESYMYVGRSTHQSYLTLVDHFYVGRSRARPKRAQYYECKYTSKNPCDLIEAVPLLRAASNLVSEERHSTSNDDNYYTDMPDLLTDDEETDDEESVN